MTEFNILPDDLKLYILSHHKIHNLRKAAVLVNKEWNVLVWHLLDQNYSSGTQEQFSQAFAVSIAQDDTRLFNLLKSIAEANNTKFILEPHLSIKDPVYRHKFMSTSISPNPKGKERGFYFYLQATDQKIYALVVHNRYIYETLCITDILHECNESKLLKYIKLPVAEDEKIHLYDIKKELTAIIRKNCKYELKAYFDKNDVIKQWEDNDDCHTSRSLLYLAINRKDYGLASYLIDCIENYISQQNIVSMNDEENEPPKKKQKVSQEEKSDDTEPNILTMPYIVDIGYEHCNEAIIITPATALLLEDNINKEARKLVKRLLHMGATVFINDSYMSHSKFYEREGYYFWDPYQTLLEVLLKKEQEFRIEIYKEIKASREDFKQSNEKLQQINEKLKQDLEKYKTELLIARVRIQELENMSVEPLEPLESNLEVKKRKRDIDNGSILTQFNSLTQDLNIATGDQSESLDIEEDNSTNATNLFKS